MITRILYLINKQDKNPIFNAVMPIDSIDQVILSKQDCKFNVDTIVSNDMYKSIKHYNPDVIPRKMKKMLDV